MNNLTQEQIDYVMDKQKKLLTILGVVSTVFLEMGGQVPNQQRPAVTWIMNALNNVIYEDKELPPLPER